MKEEQLQLTWKVHVALEVAEVAIVRVALETIVEEPDQRTLLDGIE